MLNRLEHNHLFIIPLDEKHVWFRYHHLFADFLRQVQAEINPTEIPELHKRAALWLEQNGQLDDAFGHAFASRDMEWASDMLERNVQSLSNMGEISALIRWIGKLPDELTQKRLLLGATYAWALTVTDQLDLARYWLDDVQRSLDQFENQTSENPTMEKARVYEVAGNIDLSGIQGILAICRSHLAMLSGELNRSAEFSRQATSFLPEENSYTRSLIALDESISLILSGDTQKAIEFLRTTIRIARQAHNQYVMVVAGCALAEMQAWQGQLSKAWETYQRVKNWALGPEGKPLNMTGVVDMGLGEILLERNLLEEARDHLERGCRISQSVWYIASLHGMISLARLRQALGDQAGVQAVIADTERLTNRKESSEWEDVVAPVIAIRLAVQRDDLAAAEQWWKKGGFPDLSFPIAIENYPYHVYEYIMLVQARFLLVRGQETNNTDDIKQAAGNLVKLLPEAERLQRVISQIQILILLAMAQFYVKDDTATKTLLRALAIGEPEGYRRFFLDEGWRLAELMRQCRALQQESGRHFPSLAFIDSLLKDLQRTGPTIVKLEDGIPITLSAREMEVLALIAEGKSNQEISAQLYLAINTVKRHVYNIFAKLEVEKRTQAVSKARQLGLIA
jgi:LuxR family maltose regulon positive regulatory protein